MVTLAPPTTPPDATPPVISAARRALVERACERWMHALTDRSRNNNLLCFRDLKTGTLDLTNARPHVLQQLLGGTAVRIGQQLPDATNNRPAVQARQILQRARVNQEEKGIDTLFLALGLASWQISDGNRPARPARAAAAGHAGADQPRGADTRDRAWRRRADQPGAARRAGARLWLRDRARDAGGR